MFGSLATQQERTFAMSRELSAAQIANLSEKLPLVHWIKACAAERGGTFDLEWLDPQLASHLGAGLTGYEDMRPIFRYLPHNLRMGTRLISLAFSDSARDVAHLNPFRKRILTPVSELSLYSIEKKTEGDALLRAIEKLVHLRSSIQPGTVRLRQGPRLPDLGIHDARDLYRQIRRRTRELELDDNERNLYAQLVTFARMKLVPEELINGLLEYAPRDPAEYRTHLQVVAEEFAVTHGYDSAVFKRWLGLRN